jgi:integrase
MENATSTARPVEWGPTEDGVRLYLPTGIWHFSKRVGCHLITGSSKQTKKTIATTLLAKKVAALADLPAATVRKPGKQTFGDVIAVFKHRIDGGGLDPKTKLKKVAILTSISDAWAGVAEIVVRTVSFDDLVTFRKTFLQKWSNDYFNQARCVLIDLYDIARESDPTIPNHAQRLDFASVRPKELRLPTAAEFNRIVQAIDEGVSNKFARAAKDLILGLSWTGLRIEEAQLLRKHHVDLEGWELVLPASICKGRRHGRTVPIFDEAKELFARLVAEAGPDGEIFHVKECKFTLKHACERAGWKPPLTHHKLRHYFATRCLESIKDVKVVSEWLGHLDGGALVLKTYAHVCRKFAKEAAKLVRFNVA